MKYDPNDFRITAFVLGELTEEEASDFELNMQSSNELRQAVEETRRTIGLLANELSSQPSGSLLDEQRVSIQQQMDHVDVDSNLDVDDDTTATNSDTKRRSTAIGKWPIVSAIGALAASLLVVVWFNESYQEVSPELAQFMSRRMSTSSPEANESLEFTADQSTVDGVATSPDARHLAGGVVAGETSAADDQKAVKLYEHIRMGTSSPVDHAATKRQQRQQPSIRSGKKWTDDGRAGIPLTPQSKTASTTDIRPAGRPTQTSKSFRYSIEIASELYDESATPFESIQADQGQGPGRGGDKYSAIIENPFRKVLDEPLSTFSIDVDTASFSKVRMYLMQRNMLPRPDAVRIEELVNYFVYDYDPPHDDNPFASHIEVASCPWAPAHRLVRVGIKGREVQNEGRPNSNLVFLLDVSGSMNRPNKLPLVKRGIKMLAEQLKENDRVAIVVYAGAAGLVLDSTSGQNKQAIMDAIDRLNAGGSTNGGDGIKLAYQKALDNFMPGGVNRVILCTDGDFNVGVTGTDQLVRIAEENAKAGVFLSVLGFGMGNHNDAMLEEISNRGNGNYGFVDNNLEARKLLVEQISGTLVTIAKDVKIQIEFNPKAVQSYRLIGYENRILAAQDFNDDTKDAGEIGAGHTVTALYEVVPTGTESIVSVPPVDELKYQQALGETEAAGSGELLTLKIRHKKPEEVESTLTEFAVTDQGNEFGQSTKDFRFAAAVASFGMVLRDSKYKGNSTYASVLEIASEGAVGDTTGYRAEFIKMVERAKSLSEKGE